MKSSAARRASWWFCFFLAATTLAVYFNVRHFDFISFDDPEYVSHNPHIHAGFTTESLKWAFRSGSESYWFPLTRLSHMLDWQWFGANAGGHHLTSVALHTMAAMLLFGFLFQATGEMGPSVFSALVFALHPMHVESVAWISERKDVLCAVFWFLALWAWVRYTRRPGRMSYLTVLLLFSAGLMAKPMIMTFPFLLFLLDVWPLARIQPGMGPLRGFRRRLIWEKLPFIALSIVAAVITYRTQSSGGAVAFSNTLPATIRVQNALISWVILLGKAFWPVKLSVTTPYPLEIPLWQPILAAMAIAGISAFVIKFRVRYPFLGVGWLWYLGTLLPVIGLIQAGNQARTDHATYVPYVGLSIIVGFGGAALARWRPKVTVPLRALGGAAVIAMALTAQAQTAWWRDTATLFRHATQVTRGNFEAYEHLGIALSQYPDHMQEAIGALQESVRIRPDRAAGHLNLGTALLTAGRKTEAITQFQEALGLEPRNAIAHNSLGAALISRPETRPDGVEHLQTAIRLDPGYSDAHCNLGIAMLQASHGEEAVQEFETSLRLNPVNVQAHANLAAALLEMPGDPGKAIEHLRQAVQIVPENAVMHTNLAIALLRVPGQTFEAVGELDEALRLDPGYAKAHAVYGVVLSVTPGRVQDAILHLKAALKGTSDPALVQRLKQLEAN